MRYTKTKKGMTIEKWREKLEVNEKLSSENELWAKCPCCASKMLHVVRKVRFGDDIEKIYVKCEACLANIDHVCKALGCSIDDLFPEMDEGKPVRPDGFEEEEQMNKTPLAQEDMLGLFYARCGQCGRQVKMRAAKGGPLYYVCLECGARATAKEVNEAAVNYVNALLDPDVKDQLYSAAQEFDRASKAAAQRRERAASKKVRKLQLEISHLEEELEIKRRQLAELGSEAEPCEPEFMPEDLDAYFEGWKPLDELDEDFTFKAMQAVDHFIARIEIYPDRFQLSSTLESWLAKRKAERTGKSVRPDGFEEGANE